MRTGGDELAEHAFLYVSPCLLTIVKQRISGIYGITMPFWNCALHKTGIIILTEVRGFVGKYEERPVWKL